MTQTDVQRKGEALSPPPKLHLVFRTIREGMGPKILSIMARCSLLSWVWGKKARSEHGTGKGC